MLLLVKSTLKVLQLLYMFGIWKVKAEWLNIMSEFIKSYEKNSSFGIPVFYFGP